MIGRRLVLSVVVTLLGCADGIEPPTATEVVFLPSGAFEMGSRGLDPCQRFTRSDCTGARCAVRLPVSDSLNSERIVHQQNVSAFCMDKHEVTIDQYRHCVAKGLCPRPSLVNAGDDRPGDDSFIARYWTDPERYGDYPVVGVSQAGAQAYCRSRDGRLPTEIEWEFAATGRGTQSYPWTDPALPEDVALGCESFSEQLAILPCSRSVRAVATSATDRTNDGLFDLGANVSEWTADPWEPLAYCADEQPGGLSVSDLFQLDANGRVSFRPAAALLAPDATCLSVSPDGERYQGALIEDFIVCRDQCGRPEISEENFASCLRSCFDEFDANGCASTGVQSICARISSASAECLPSPWCVPRGGTSEATDSEIRDGDDSGYVVRGGHFQNEALCEARPTGRRGVRLGDSQVGFRCVFEPQHARCIEAQ